MQKWLRAVSWKHSRWAYSQFDKRVMSCKLNTELMREIPFFVVGHIMQIEYRVMRAHMTSVWETRLNQRSCPANWIQSQRVKSHPSWWVTLCELNTESCVLTRLRSWKTHRNWASYVVIQKSERDMQNLSLRIGHVLQIKYKVRHVTQDDAHKPKWVFKNLENLINKEGRGNA